MKKEIDRKNKLLYIIGIIVVTLVILQTFFYCKRESVLLIRAEYLRNATIDITGIFMCGVLIFSLTNNKPWDAQNRALFRLVTMLCLLLHCNVSAFVLKEHADSVLQTRIYYNLLFVGEPFLVYCFWSYVCTELQIDRKKIPLINGICIAAPIIHLILILLNNRYGFFFTISEEGFFNYSPLYNLEEIFPFVIYGAILYVVLVNKTHTVKEKLILMSFEIFQLIAHFLSVTQDAFSLVYPAYIFSVMLIYINVFATRSKKILEQQVEIEKQRTTLMISQIQPHFLYNVLTTISNLCVTDPEEAEETTVLFSQYLRTNLDSLRKSDPVPFGVELGHIMTYIELEKKRFGDKINEEINCPERNFKVPALGLQPIVENSIKHGIREKDGPGHLKITSSRVKGGYEVVIEDDGAGFDMNAPLPEDGRSHVGMKNVKSRLEQMCGAKVTVNSSPGNGCRTEIFFPEDPDR